jgi:hypothetical protein
MKGLKALATIAAVVLAGCLMADSIISAIDREMEYREKEAVALRVAACGEGYAADYASAVQRIGRTNGYEIHHELNCTVRVVKQEF